MKNKILIGIGFSLLISGVVGGAWAVASLPNELATAENELKILTQNLANSKKQIEIAQKNSEIAEKMYWGKFCRIAFLKKAGNIPLKEPSSNEHFNSRCLGK